MYAVKCYDPCDIDLPHTHYFNTFTEARDYADKVNRFYLVDIITPNGEVICAN